jgi:CheY-like chemotaxis protein
MENSQVEIILVEDNIDDAEMTIRALQKGNIVNKLIHLKDGVEALNFLFGLDKYKSRIITKLPKVILLDLKMPRLNGLEFLEKIKANELTKHIPVVVLTSSKEHPDIEKCYELGVNSYIVKPVQFDDFTRAIVEIGLYWVILNQPPAK